MEPPLTMTKRAFRAQAPTAIVAEWLNVHGGAERVIEEIAAAVPSSTVETVTAEKGALPTLARERINRRGAAGRLVTARKITQVVANMATWPRWRAEDHGYERVISSHHLGSHWSAIRSDVPHFSYVHTPARYVWFPELDDRASSPIGRPVVAAIKKLDRTAADTVTEYAANSETTRKRIQQVWGRDARVINPPVDTDRIAASREDVDRSYLVALGRFIPYKHHSFAIEVAEQAGLPLRIIGSGPLEDDLRRAAAKVPNVEVLTDLSDAEVASQLWGAKALIYPAVEDFGIVPVEAMAAGVPVVAPDVAGTAESVIDGLTGRLMPDFDPGLWARAVKGLDCSQTACIDRAEEFGVARFRHQILEWLGEPAVVSPRSGRLAL